MAWTLQGSSLGNSEGETTVEMQKSSQSISLPGGKIALATVGACAVAVIAVQVVDDLSRFSPLLGTSTPVVAKVEMENLNRTSIVVDQQFPTLPAP